MSEINAEDEAESPEEMEDRQAEAQPLQKEYGGPKGKEPTRYGDWEKKGRCIDF